MKNLGVIGFVVAALFVAGCGGSQKSAVNQKTQRSDSSLSKGDLAVQAITYTGIKTKTGKYQYLNSVDTTATDSELVRIGTDSGYPVWAEFHLVLTGDKNSTFNFFYKEYLTCKNADPSSAQTVYRTTITGNWQRSARKVLLPNLALVSKIFKLNDNSIKDEKTNKPLSRVSVNIMFSHDIKSSGFANRNYTMIWSEHDGSLADLGRDHVTRSGDIESSAVAKTVLDKLCPADDAPTPAPAPAPATAPAAPAPAKPATTHSTAK